mmetsp:Transcript_15082/g.19564  ORF Transcript_15082/g.19564 Transcript_15082/m.19564 type:complete len:378 (+) Transcript_15082:93-1226(+)
MSLRDLTLGKLCIIIVSCCIITYLMMIPKATQSTQPEQFLEENEIKHVLCTTSSRQITLASYISRCKLLAEDFEKYYPQIKLHVLSIDDVPEDVNYIATISIKHSQQIFPLNFGEIFIDVIDDYSFGQSNQIPSNYGVITQNYAHAKTFSNQKSVHVIDHSYSVRNQIKYQDSTSLMNHEENSENNENENYSLKNGGVLSLVSILYGEHGTCFNPKDYDIVYNCLRHDDIITNIGETMKKLTYISDKKLDSIISLNYNYESVLYDLLYQQYNLIVIYEKPTQNKHKYGSMQPIINAFQSGTATIIHSVDGGVFKHFLDYYDYDCWFDDQDSFVRLTAKMKLKDDRQWCINQAKLIISDYHPKVNIQKYVNMLETDEF